MWLLRDGCDPIQRFRRDDAGRGILISDGEAPPQFGLIDAEVQQTPVSTERFDKLLVVVALAALPEAVIENDRAAAPDQFDELPPHIFDGRTQQGDVAIGRVVLPKSTVSCLQNVIDRQSNHPGEFQRPGVGRFP